MWCRSTDYFPSTQDWFLSQVHDWASNTVKQIDINKSQRVVNYYVNDYLFLAERNYKNMFKKKCIKKEKKNSMTDHKCAV